MADASSLALPASVVLRLAKEALPDGFAVSRAAKEAMARAAGVFALALGSTASEVARDRRRATVAATDVIRALEELDLGEHIPPLPVWLTAQDSVRRIPRIDHVWRALAEGLAAALQPSRQIDRAAPSG